MRWWNLLLIIRGVLVRSRSPRPQDPIAAAISSPPMGCPATRMTTRWGLWQWLHKVGKGRLAVRKRDRGGGEGRRKRERKNWGGDCHGWGLGEGERVDIFFNMVNLLFWFLVANSFNGIWKVNSVKNYCIFHWIPSIPC